MHCVLECVCAYQNDSGLSVLLLIDKPSVHDTGQLWNIVILIHHCNVHIGRVLGGEREGRERERGEREGGEREVRRREK